MHLSSPFMAVFTFTSVIPDWISENAISCVFYQAALMLFELAWVLTKDTKDMLW